MLGLGEARGGDQGQKNGQRANAGIHTPSLFEKFSCTVMVCTLRKTLLAKPKY